MAINDKIRDQNLQQDINREAAKIPAFSSGKIDKNDTTFTLKQTITDSWVKLLKIEIIADYVYIKF